jgi:hypothetical protein
MLGGVTAAVELAEGAALDSPAPAGGTASGVRELSQDSVAASTHAAASTQATLIEPDRRTTLDAPTRYRSGMRRLHLDSESAARLTLETHSSRDA